MADEIRNEVEKENVPTASPETPETSTPETPTEEKAKVHLVKIPRMSKEEMDEALKEVEDFEENPDGVLSMKELANDLMVNNTKKNSTLSKKAYKKAFESHGDKHFYNPENETPTNDLTAIDKHAYSLILKSLNSKTTFLEGEVAMVNKDEINGQTIVVADIFLGSYVVKIPVSEFMWLPNLQERNDNVEPLTVDLLYKYMKARKGTTVDFKVTSFDAQKKVAYASRLQAMGVIGFANYVKKDKTLGRPRIGVGTNIIAEVVSASSSFVICEAYGSEFMIRDNELEWGGVTDVWDSYHIGDKIYVKVTKIKSDSIVMGKDAQGNPRRVKKVTVTASQREATRNPFEDAVKILKKDTSLQAVITQITYNSIRYAIKLPCGTLNKVFSEIPMNIAPEDYPRVGDTIDASVKYINPDKELIELRYGHIIKRGNR